MIIPHSKNWDAPDVTQHYTTEYQRAEALRQKVQELQQYADTRDELLKHFQQELRNSVPKLNIAIHMLKKLPPGAQRERCLEIFQEACTNEIALLNQMPNLEYFLTPEDVKLLRQFHKPLA